jgi:hypothetical protein
MICVPRIRCVAGDLDKRSQGLAPFETCLLHPIIANDALGSVTRSQIPFGFLQCTADGSILASLPLNMLRTRGSRRNVPLIPF